MDKYTQVLEFFMKSGVKLSPDQMKELNEACKCCDGEKKDKEESEEKDDDSDEEEED